MARTKQLAASKAHMRYLFDDAPAAIALLTGESFLVEQAHQYIRKIWGKTPSVNTY